MFSREWIEKFDASYGIPRKANEQYLPSYQAFWQWSADIGMCLFFITLGLLGSLLCLYAGILLDVYGLITLVFWAMALICVAGSFVDAYSLMWAYRVRRMSTAHGSARWAKASDLIRCGLMNRIKGLPLPANALPLAKAFRGRDVFLPASQWLRHFVMFGPTGSGKSKTFFMSMIRAILKKSSCLVYDPKGELFAQTAKSAKTIYRLDLNDPTKSDRWNFIPKCRNDPAFACQIAGMMIGIEGRRRTNADPFWGDAEQIALTAILLHISEVYREKAIPAFAADFLLFLSGESDEAFNDAMMNSPSLYAKQAYLAFRQAPVQTRGSILIGLYNKLRPFTLAPARMVTSPPAKDETALGCRVIDFSDLRESGTAVYLVVSEGAADVYKELIATFIGQAVMEMRLDGVNEPEFPCFVLIDEAYQLNVSEVKRISGIGRGRGVGLGLGYQDLPQMYDQYGREQANAILGTIMTKIFLPGLDDVTADYASKQLGDTTIFSKTFQDYPGKKQDNTRYAEQKRALMLPTEIRQTAAHSEVLIISDTAPPIRAAYPPFAVSNEMYLAPNKGAPKEVHLGDIDAQFSLSGDAGKVKLTDPERTSLKEIISAGVDRVLSSERIAELVGSSPSETESDFLLDVESAENSDLIKNALHRLPEDVRFMTTSAPVSQLSQI
ncbi:MAG: type IV secretory system conjugative DNA transfer family protein [Acidobacteria bacterium]|nr:type IV secretory system conjugative DNA transfer family protein [Acidobacteriota bacterium]